MPNEAIAICSISVSDTFSKPADALGQLDQLELEGVTQSGACDEHVGFHVEHNNDLSQKTSMFPIRLPRKSQ